MKEVYFLRHAEAERNYQDDFNRNLTEKGLRDAAHRGEIMRENNLFPDFVICSPVPRVQQTRSTAFNIAFAGRVEPNVKIDPSYCEQLSCTALLEDIRQQVSNDITKLMIIGHEPALKFAAIMLAGANGLQQVGDFVPGTLSVHHLDIQKWTDLKAGIGRLVNIYKP